MDRIIKFRAWLKELEEMIPSDRVLGFIMEPINEHGKMDRILKYSNLPLKWGAYSIEEENSENYEIMQFTGLKDKNDKEIYEGDIIELINADNNKIRVVCEYGIVRRKILATLGLIANECDIPSFYFKLSNGVKTFPIVNNYQGKHDTEIFEIIGNIYQTPELLAR